MGMIAIEGMEFFAYHGCFEEERIIGGRFVVDLCLDAETGEAGLSDDIHKTVDYQKVYKAVKEEMEIKSKLLEHLAVRIADKVLKDFPAVKGLIVKVAKMHPPVGGKVDKVSITIKRGSFQEK